MSDRNLWGPAERRLRLWLGLTVFVCTAYFFGGGADNQNARLDPIYAFSEPGTPDTGTFRIDRFLSQQGKINTGDWAVHAGHIYSNKAPGTIWLGILAYEPILLVERWFGLACDAPRVVLANAYLINLAVSVLPLVLGVLAMFELALAMGAAPAAATWVALATSLGTLWFPFSTQLWGHTTAAAFAAMALAQVQRATQRSVTLAGCLAGMAVCTDYLAIVSAVAVGVWLLFLRPRLVPYLLLGALPTVLALMAYHTLCFGAPWVTASQMSNPKFLEQERALGMFGSLSGKALWSLTFGERRGLFVQCPVLLLCGVGFFRWIKSKPRDALAYVCLGTSLSYVLINASFNGWHGGSSVGARYLINALPFLGLALHALPWSKPRVWMTTGLLGISTLNMFAVAAVNPLVPENIKSPLYGFTWPMLVEGRVSPYALSLRQLSSDPAWKEIRRFCMCNLGQLLGLGGLTSLLPLLLCGVALMSWGWFIHSDVRSTGTDA